MLACRVASLLLENRKHVNLYVEKRASNVCNTCGGYKELHAYVVSLVYNFNRTIIFVLNTNCHTGRYDFIKNVYMIY